MTTLHTSPLATGPSEPTAIDYPGAPYRTSDGVSPDLAVPMYIEDTDPTIPNPTASRDMAARDQNAFAGGPSTDEWMVLLYDDLRKLAHARMRQQRPNHTLQPTALLHEAYARMKKRKMPCGSRAYFYFRAARAMRNVLVDYARRRASLKRGGDLQRVTCTTSVHDEDQSMTVEELLSLNRALEHLQKHQPDIARMVLLRYFGGLTTREVAETMAISKSTVDRHLRVARAWLKGRLQPPSASAR